MKLCRQNTTLAGLKTALLLVLMILQVADSQTLPRLYIMGFDQLDQNADLVWLREGFKEYLLAHLKNRRDIQCWGAEMAGESLQQFHQKILDNPLTYWILTGNFQRSGGRFRVNLLMADLKTWEKIASREIQLNTGDLAKVIEQINTTVDEMLDGLLPQPAIAGQSQSPVITRAEIPIPKLPALTQTSTAARQLSFALDKLETLVKSDQPLPVTGDNESTVSKPLHFGEQQFVTGINLHFDRAQSVNQVLQSIWRAPYEILIGEPEIFRITPAGDLLKVSFQIDFRLQRSLIDEMVTIFPVTMTDKAQFREYQFDGRRFIFPDDMMNAVSSGDYRLFPVLLLKNDQRVMMSVIDIPFKIGNPGQSRQVRFMNRFTPGLNMSSGTDGLRLSLSKIDQQIRYEFEIPLHELRSVTRIDVLMLSESEIVPFLINN